MTLDPTPHANLRDLGGTAVAGGLLRPGLLWRGDDPSIAPAHEVAALTRAGVADIIDVRGEVEFGLLGIGAFASHPVRHHRVELESRPRKQLAEAIERGGPGFERAIGLLYADLALANLPALVRIVELVAQATGGALVHCTAGKDRTGVAIAAILTVLGATDATIATDYAATDANMVAIARRVEPVLAAIRPVAPDVPGPVQWSVFMSAPRGAMLAMLGHLRNEHGGLAEVLRTAGLSPEIEHRLRARLVAPRPG